MNDRFTELLPYYVNGTLGTADQAWVEAHLHAHPEAQSELRWMRSLRDRMLEATPDVSPEIGIERALGKIRGDQRIAAARADLARPASFADQIRAWFGRIGMSPALAVAVGVIAIQAGLLMNVTNTVQDQTSEIRALKRPTAVEALRVTFKPDAREEAIRLALAEIGGTIVAGPSSLGDYYVRVSGALPTAADRLKQAAVVESVSIVDQLPARD